MKDIMPKIKEKRDAVAGKMADLLEEIGNDRDGSRILHLSSPVRIMNAEVNIIERKDGQIALNDGKRPDYFLSDMTDRELDSLYRSLISTELTSDKARSEYLNNFVVDIGRQKVELPLYSNLEATLKDTGEKLHVDWLRSVKTASEGKDGIMRFPLYLGSYGDGAHPEQKEITLDDLDFDGLRAFEGNFRKMTEELMQGKGQAAAGGSRARFLDDDHTFVRIMENELSALADTGLPPGKGNISNFRYEGSTGGMDDTYSFELGGRFKVRITTSQSDDFIKKNGQNSIKVKDAVAADAAGYTTYHCSPHTFLKLDALVQKAHNGLELKDMETRQLLRDNVIHAEEDVNPDLWDYFEFDKPVVLSGKEYVGIQYYTDEYGDDVFEINGPDSKWKTDYDSLPSQDKGILYDAVKEQAGRNLMYKTLGKYFKDGMKANSLLVPVRISNGDEISGIMIDREEHDNPPTISQYGKTGWLFAGTDGKVYDRDDLSGDDGEKIAYAVMERNILDVLKKSPDLYNRDMEFENDSLGVSVPDGKAGKADIVAIYPNLPTPDGSRNHNAVNVRVRRQDGIVVTEPLSQLLKSSGDPLGLAESIKEKTEQLRNRTDQRRLKYSQFAKRYAPREFLTGEEVPVIDKVEGENVFTVTEHDAVNPTGYFKGQEEVIISAERLQGSYEAYIQKTARSEGTVMKEDPGHVFYVLVGNIYKDGSYRDESLFDARNLDALADAAPSEGIEWKSDIGQGDIGYDNVLSRFHDKAEHGTEEIGEGDRYGVVLRHDGDYTDLNRKQQKTYAEVWKKLTANELVQDLLAMSPGAFDEWKRRASKDVLPVFERAERLGAGRPREKTVADKEEQEKSNGKENRPRTAHVAQPAGGWHGDRQNEQRVWAGYGAVVARFGNSHISNRELETDYYYRDKDPVKSLVLTLHSANNNYLIPLYMTKDGFSGLGVTVRDGEKPVKVLEDGRIKELYNVSQTDFDPEKSGRNREKVQEMINKAFGEHGYDSGGRVLLDGLEKTIGSDASVYKTDSPVLLYNEDTRDAAYDKSAGRVVVKTEDVGNDNGDRRADNILQALTEKAFDSNAVERKYPSEDGYFYIARMMNAVNFGIDINDTPRGQLRSERAIAEERLRRELYIPGDRFSRFEKDPQFTREVLTKAAEAAGRVTEYAEGKTDSLEPERAEDDRQSASLTPEREQDKENQDNGIKGIRL